MNRAKPLMAALAAATLQFAAPASAAAESVPLQASYPVVVTDRMTACRDFYVRWLGYRVVFEASWFVYLASGTHGVAFMSPDHPSRPPGPEKFSGKGLFLTLQVADAEALFRRLKQAGVAIAYPVRDEAWGQRRFGLVDPSGMWVDVVQQIEPAPGYWDKYVPAGKP